MHCSNITMLHYSIRFTLSLIYYGLSLNTGRLPGSVYLNSFLMSAVEVPANLLGIFLLSRIGRKWTTGGATLMAGFSTIICIPFLLDSSQLKFLFLFFINACKLAWIVKIVYLINTIILNLEMQNTLLLTNEGAQKQYVTLNLRKSTRFQSKL